MRKLLGMVAILALVAAPAMAELSSAGVLTNPQVANLQPTGEHTVGIYGNHPVYGPVIYYDIIATPVAPSDNIHLTFAFHWPYITYVGSLQVQWQWVYDNSEVQTVHMAGAGAYTGPNNIPNDAFWPNPTAGTIVVGDVLGTGVPIFANPAAGVWTNYGSSIYPFMQVDLHVKNVINDGFLDAYVGQFANLFTIPGYTGTYWTQGNIGQTSFGLLVGAPEPASLALLGLGVAGIGGGIWRRRRA